MGERNRLWVGGIACMPAREGWLYLAAAIDAFSRKVAGRSMSDRTSKAAIDAMKLDAVNIIDRASVPENPSGPNRVMYTAVALLAGLFVAIAIIVLQDMLDTTVKSGDDAEELLGIPVLGRMPKPKKAR